MAIEYGKSWRARSGTEFEAYLRRYPLPLTLGPPSDQRARFHATASPPAQARAGRASGLAAHQPAREPIPGVYQGEASRAASCTPPQSRITSRMKGS
jgi:hypothetical protein